MTVSAADLEKLTVVQLREQLKTRALPVTGKKPELIARLVQSYKTEAEDKILDGDLDAITEDDVLGLDASHPISTGSSSSSSSKPKAAITKKAVAPAAVVPKPAATVVAASVTAAAPAAIAKPPPVEDAKAKRAERFGLPPSAEELKNQRAERFGTATAVGKLAERAARFGIESGTTDGGASAEEMTEKKRARAERFGLPVAAAGVDAVTGVKLSKEEIDAKKQQRAERFGTATSNEKLVKRAARFGGTAGDAAEVDEKKRKRSERFAV